MSAERGRWSRRRGTAATRYRRRCPYRRSRFPRPPAAGPDSGRPQIGGTAGTVETRHSIGNPRQGEFVARYSMADRRFVFAERPQLVIKNPEALAGGGFKPHAVQDGQWCEPFFARELAGAIRPAARKIRAAARELPPRRARKLTAGRSSFGRACTPRARRRGRPGPDNYGCECTRRSRCPC